MTSNTQPTPKPNTQSSNPLPKSIFGDRNFDWKLQSNSANESHCKTYERLLGPTEVSYYLGSRGEGIEGGVNDMYLHIGFKANSNLVPKERITLIWTELITRHPLLSSKVVFKDYDDIKFVYESPSHHHSAYDKAKTLLEFKVNQDPKELLDAYLNGSRILSDNKLSKLIISTPSSTFSSDSVENHTTTKEHETVEEQEFDFYLFCTHFLGDGMALHTAANEFFNLLSSPSNNSTTSIEIILATRVYDTSHVESEKELLTLPRALESQILIPDRWNKFAWAAAKVDFKNHESKLIGGQSFPKPNEALGSRKTLVPTISYSQSQTLQILKTCKSKNSTISNAVFALCNIAQIRSREGDDSQEPCMLYSALNIRPFLKKFKSDWYHIAIGYYNIILPSFLPSTSSSSNATETFWLRTKSTRTQTSKVVKSKFLNSRILLMALERESRSIRWEREDDAKRERKVEEKRIEEKLKEVQIGDVAVEKKKIAERALMGVSMLGNLDGMYSHSAYEGITLHTLTTGSRQRPSSLLLFAYTFAGKLWFSLGYDSNGFKEGVVENWWKELHLGVEEFLLV